ncbi:MAG TPA: argininosuccinate lyase [Gemmatimonadaceae bacterium]|jgi:argininosuccinate lyase|nr:argininosuccinate lyase [Gemmatimonadaceae bacterium]
MTSPSTPPRSLIPAPHRLWGGRFASGSAPALDALNRSIDVDFRLWPFDIRASKAWAVALWNAGVLTLDESERLEQGLDAVAAAFESGATPVASDEDVHTMIDRLLHEQVGDVASKLHTGRSRNDQVATATRLWAMNACADLDAAIRALQSVILDKAAALDGALMPAYTHLQRAQPVAATHWMLSHFWPLDRDRARLHHARESAAQLPLGSGAIAGSAFPISRVLLQGSLGFSAISRNSIDAVSDRDFVAEILFVAALLGAHLSRLAEDLILFGTGEFGFARYGEAYTTGSSMMPQKRNPDALELARASGARVLGDLTALLATLKGLPTGYNKDLQEDKRALFDAVDTMQLVLPALSGALAETTFRTDRMRAALSSAMMATDLADYLVRKGVSFREAHQVVGALVREAESQECELYALPLRSFTAAHASFGQDAFDALSANASVERREVEGGTGPRALAAQLEAARASLRPPSNNTARSANELETWMR